MLDIGWSELLVIGVVALVVIGPKDLPVMFAALGRFTAKARSMAREFSRAMEDAAKTSGVSDVAKDLKGMTSPKSLGLDKVQQAVTKFEAWDPMKKSAPAVKAPTAPVAGAGAAASAGSAAAASTQTATGLAADSAGPVATSANGAGVASADIVPSAAASAAPQPGSQGAAQPVTQAAPPPVKPALPPVDPLNGT